MKATTNLLIITGKVVSIEKYYFYFKMDKVFDTKENKTVEVLDFVDPAFVIIPEDFNLLCDKYLKKGKKISIKGFIDSNQDVYHILVLNIFFNKFKMRKLRKDENEKSVYFCEEFVFVNGVRRKIVIEIRKIGKKWNTIILTQWRQVIQQFICENFKSAKYKALYVDFGVCQY